MTDKVRALRGDFLVAEIYGIYKAITEVAGEDGWKIMWRSGELAFQVVEPQLTFASHEPLEVLRTVGKYFVEVGYLEDIQFELKPNGHLEYSMMAGLTRPAASRLMAEHAILPHWSTVMLVAALRKLCGVEAKMEAHDHKPEMLNERHTLERWVLTKDGVPIS